MSLDTNHFFRLLTDKFSSGFLANVFSNPLCVSIFITFAFIIILLYFHDNKHYVRTTIRLLFISACLIFLNNHLLLRNMKNKNKIKETNEILDAIGGASKFDEDTVLPFQ